MAETLSVSPLSFQRYKPPIFHLNSSFLPRLSARCSSLKKRAAIRGLKALKPVRSEIGGQYEETFADVERQMVNIFTFKALRTVLAQLQETDPTQYKYLYSFAVENNPSDGKYFIKELLKDRQDLGQRIIEVRMHLFKTWSKKYNHSELQKVMADQNVELLRERLMQTVKFETDEEKTSG